jgi:hypothetical protein
VSSAVKTPTSPLTEPFSPAGSMDTVKVIVSTPGPRLVTPTVIRPIAGCDFRPPVAQAAAQQNTDAATHCQMRRGTRIDSTS